MIAVTKTSAYLVWYSHWYYVSNKENNTFSPSPGAQGSAEAWERSGELRAQPLPHPQYGICCVNITFLRRNDSINQRDPRAPYDIFEAISNRDG